MNTEEFLKHNPNILDQKEKLLEYTKKILQQKS